MLAVGHTEEFCSIDVSDESGFVIISCLDNGVYRINAMPTYCRTPFRENRFSVVFLLKCANTYQGHFSHAD